MSKPTFSQIPEGIANMARAAPGGTEVLPPAAPQSAPPVVEQKGTEQPAAVSAHRPVFPRKEAKQTMNLRVPQGLYDELRDFMKMTDIPMTEVLVEGARKELARLKKQYGLE